MIDISGQSYLEGREAAALLGVKPETLYAYVSRGRLRSYRQGIGRRRLYLKAEVEALLALQPSEPPPASVDSRTTFSVGDPPMLGRFPAADTWAAER